MLSAPHILETALLILVAFLTGCVVGYFARRLVAPQRKATSTEAAAATATTPAPATDTQPQLVVAPTIAPLPDRKPRLSAAGRLAAAASRERDDGVDAAAAPLASATAPAATEARAEPGTESAVAVEAPPASTLQPARAPGEVAAGVHLAVAEPEPIAPAPPVAPEPADAPVRAEDVPPIDEAAHVVAAETVTPSPELLAAVVDPDAEMAEPAEAVAREESEAADEPAVAAVPESEPVAEPAVIELGADEPPVLSPAPPERISPGEDTEVAAMRAVEGAWTPRRTSPSAPRREESAVEVDAAMATARTAVAAATAAANAAIAEAAEPAPVELEFEPEHAAHPASFLAADPAGEPAHDPEPASAEPALDFEPERPRFGYGRPEALPAPRPEGKDNLRQIKGITPQLEASLNALGVFHFDQIAAWDQKAIVWLDHNLTLKGRIGREKWQEQARELAKGRRHPARPVKR